MEDTIMCAAATTQLRFELQSRRVRHNSCCGEDSAPSADYRPALTHMCGTNPYHVRPHQQTQAPAAARTLMRITNLNKHAMGLGGSR